MTNEAMTDETWDGRMDGDMVIASPKVGTQRLGGLLRYDHRRVKESSSDNTLPGFLRRFDCDSLVDSRFRLPLAHQLISHFRRQSRPTTHSRADHHTVCMSFQLIDRTESGIVRTSPNVTI
jgi:hypothetical protein